jgi:8-oxo-dGTP diphosphatase
LVYVDTIEKLLRDLKPVSEEADAAVAILLKPFNRDLRVLFAKRVENPTDPWSGQIALPGGKRDAKDQDLKQTVARETLEETNINVLDRCRFLGTLPVQRSKPRPEIRILPFVILVEHEPTIKLGKQEIESYVWIALEELQRHRGTFKLNLGEVDAYIIENYVIWGLTYRILENLFRILQQ